MFPREWVFNLCELCWRSRVEMKMHLRELQTEMQTETPSKEDIRFYALAPDGEGKARLRMPTAFQLLARDAYYQRVVVP